MCVCRSDSMPTSAHRSSLYIIRSLREFSPLMLVIAANNHGIDICIRRLPRARLFQVCLPSANALVCRAQEFQGAFLLKKRANGLDYEHSNCSAGARLSDRPRKAHTTHNADTDERKEKNSMSASLSHFT